MILTLPCTTILGKLQAKRPTERRVPHTFAVFECVGENNRFRSDVIRGYEPASLIPKPGMSGAPGLTDAFASDVSCYFSYLCLL